MTLRPASHQLCFPENPRRVQHVVKKHCHMACHTRVPERKHRLSPKRSSATWLRGPSFFAKVGPGVGGVDSGRNGHAFTGFILTRGPDSVISANTPLLNPLGAAGPGVEPPLISSLLTEEQCYLGSFGPWRPRGERIEASLDSERINDFGRVQIVQSSTSDMRTHPGTCLGASGQYRTAKGPSGF